MMDTRSPGEPVEPTRTKMSARKRLDTGADMSRAWMNHHWFRRRSWRAIACGLATAVSVGVIVGTSPRARSFEPSAQEQGERRATTDRDRTTTSSGPVKPGLKQSADYGQTDAAAAASDSVKRQLGHRPPRTVSPPTLTPADLDRLIAQYL